MSYDTRDNPNRKNDSVLPPKRCTASADESVLSHPTEFFQALGDAHTYNLRRNVYMFFGLLWGLPIPLFSVSIDILASGHDLNVSEFFYSFVLHPAHFIFALHPILFAIVFGAMGTIRYKKEAQIQRLVRELESKVEELATANQKLKELDRMKRDFVANITHELKTPLVSIYGYNEMIVEGRLGPVSEKQKQGLDTALRNVDRLSSLIDELLELSKIDSGQLRLNKDVFSIEGQISAVLRNFAPQMEQKRLQMDVQLPTAPSRVFADADKITRVLTNLISNAVKFTPEGGRISVTVCTLDTGVASISIRDTGCGIPEKLRTHLFQRFWQADSSSTRKYKGTGLGLAIVKGILDAHGAPLVVQSEEGVGTTVTFDLPLAGETVSPHLSVLSKSSS